MPRNGRLGLRPVRETPEPLTYGEHLPAVYRFALLMTGSVPLSAEVLRLTVEQAERGDLNDVRDPRRVKRWLFARARALCACPLSGSGILTASPVHPAEGDPSLPGFADDAPTRQLLALFAVLPEPERCALILFYLYLFDPAQLAEVLEVKPDALAALLTHGRTLLQNQREACDNLLLEKAKDG